MLDLKVSLTLLVLELTRCETGFLASIKGVA